MSKAGNATSCCWLMLMAVKRLAECSDRSTRARYEVEREMASGTRDALAHQVDVSRKARIVECAAPRIPMIQ